MYIIKAKGKKLKAKTLSELIKQLTRLGLKGKLIPKKGLKNVKFLSYIDLEEQEKAMQLFLANEQDAISQALSDEQDAISQALSDEQAAQDEAIAQFEADQQEALADYQEAQLAMQQEYNEMLIAAEESLRTLQKEEQAMLKAAKEMQEDGIALLASLDEEIEFIFVPKKRK
jgi:hypothetical protein